MRARSGILFVMPAMITLVVLIAFPVIYTIVLSVTSIGGQFVGLSNFEMVLKARVTMTGFINTIWWVLGSVFFQVVLGVATAILLNQSFPGRGVLRAIALIPWVVPGIVVATTWAWMFHTDFGIINYILTGTGLVSERVGWLTNSHTVLPALIIINIWKMFPFVAVMILAGLQSIPEDLYEAARVDGANFWQEVWYVMLPGVRPVLTAVILLLIIWALNAITIIYAITKGGPANKTLTTPIQIFRMAFENVQFNQAAALSVIFFAVTIVIVFTYIKMITNQPGTAQ